MDEPKFTGRRRYRITGSFSIRASRAEPTRRRSRWYDTYPGSSGLIFLGAAAYVAYRGDFRVAVLITLGGLAAIAYAVSLTRRRNANASPAMAGLRARVIARWPSRNRRQSRVQARVDASCISSLERPYSSSGWWALCTVSSGAPAG